MSDCRFVVEGVLYVLAKEPNEGRVKTRLTPKLTPSQACRCHRAFVEDSVARLSRVAGITTRLAGTPDGRSSWLEGLAARFGIELEEQGSGDLGARLARLLARGVEAGRPTVAIGSDTPDLPIAHVRDAFAALGSAKAVVGPSEDGGYYAIGCRDRVPPVFRLDSAWGGEGVLDETLARLDTDGTPVRILRPWPDVDEYRDLKELASRVRGAGSGAGELPATLRLIDELCAEGVEL